MKKANRASEKSPHSTYVSLPCETHQSRQHHLDNFAGGLAKRDITSRSFQWIGARCFVNRNPRVLELIDIPLELADCLKRARKYQVMFFPLFQSKCSIRRVKQEILSGLVHKEDGIRLYFQGGAPLIDDVLKCLVVIPALMGQIRQCPQLIRRYGFVHGQCAGFLNEALIMLGETKVRILALARIIAQGFCGSWT